MEVSNISFIPHKSLRTEENLKSNVKLQGTDFSNQKMREAFQSFLQEVKYSARCNNESELKEVLSCLKVQHYSLPNADELAEIFENLISKPFSERHPTRSNWCDNETNYLISLVVYYCAISGKEADSLTDSDWGYMGLIFPKKEAYHLRKRWNSLTKASLLQSPWTIEEDKLLKKLVGQYGAERQWKKIAEALNTTFKNGAFRQSRQCRERWINHVDPSVKRDSWSPKDDAKLMEAYLQVGKKWSNIAKMLGNRTENAVRNRWNSLIKKRNHLKEKLDENLSLSNEDYEMKIAKSIIFSQKDAKNSSEGIYEPSYEEEKSYEIEEATGQDSLLPYNEVVPSYANNASSEEQYGQFNQSNAQLGVHCSEQATKSQVSYCSQNQYDQYGYLNKTMPMPTNYQEMPQYMQGAPQYDYSMMYSNTVPMTSSNQREMQYSNFTFGNLQPQGYNNPPPLSNPNTFHPMRITNRVQPSQYFNNEIKKADSQVFYALVDIEKNVIQLIEKATENNIPSYFGGYSRMQNYYSS